MVNTRVRVVDDQKGDTHLGAFTHYSKFRITAPISALLMMIEITLQNNDAANALIDTTLLNGLTAVLKVDSKIRHTFSGATFEVNHPAQHGGMWGAWAFVQGKQFPLFHGDGTIAKSTSEQRGVTVFTPVGLGGDDIGQEATIEWTWDAPTDYTTTGAGPGVVNPIYRVDAYINDNVAYTTHQADKTDTITASADKQVDLPDCPIEGGELIAVIATLEDLTAVAYENDVSRMRLRTTDGQDIVDLQEDQMVAAMKAAAGKDFYYRYNATVGDVPTAVTDMIYSRGEATGEVTFSNAARVSGFFEGVWYIDVPPTSTKGLKLIVTGKATVNATEQVNVRCIYRRPISKKGETLKQSPTTGKPAGLEGNQQRS